LLFIELSIIYLSINKLISASSLFAKRKKVVKVKYKIELVVVVL
jgi:hypothetical protein